jgi:hypothetical protein
MRSQRTHTAPAATTALSLRQRDWRVASACAAGFCVAKERPENGVLSSR